jgi:hypothetical protein
MARTTEFVLGLIGGIFGFLTAPLAFLTGVAFALTGQTDVAGAALWTGLLGAMLFSTLGIIGSVIVRKKRKVGGWFMIIAAFGGLLCNFLFFILPFILLLIGGIMGVFVKGGEVHES